MNICLKCLYSAVDLQTYFNICLQCQGRTNGGVTPFHVEIMAANQPNFKFLLENLSQSVKTFCLEIKPLINENYDTLGRIVTSRCNDAVGNINSTEKFHQLALRFSKIFLRPAGRWFLADTIPNFIEQ